MSKRPLPTRIDALSEALAGELPGNAPKREFWPLPVRRWPSDSERATARRAAVLLALHQVEGGFAALLMRRAEFDGDVHSGQLALPGGGIEPDESALEAALRESEEEIGLPPRDVEILGGLSEHWIPVSRYLVSPFVGFVRELPQLRPEPGEVDAVISLPIGVLLDPARRGHFPRDVRGETLQIPCWKLKEGNLWGATAMILAEFLSIWRKLSEAGD